MNHPHDKLFKQTFSQPAVVASLIQDLFPPELAAEIDLNSLQLTNNSYIDEALNEHFADLVYQCTLRNLTVFRIALLLEHKSYPDKHPHLQLLRYMLNHWQQDVQHGTGLTPIIPVVIYHGNSRWTYRSLASQLAGFHESLRQYIPDFEYILVDLSHLDDERILAFRNKFLALSSMLLKYHDNRRYIRVLKQHIQSLLATVTVEELAALILPTFLYLSETSNLTSNEIVAIFKMVSQKTEQVAMNAAEQLRMEGRLEGRQQGHQEATVAHIKGLLELGLTTADIAKAFKLPEKTVLEIVQQLKNRES
ncbi:Rpn family recombination-promoting nuclease/putative transposase [Larkinella sp. VNQ87]|uniref:Rpn family recombination-promoting nuclease/putative transposase n=1 Tax=Larkinella sp. VNQ87 TaxID=3400921 RepID=UPI003C0B59F1